MDKSQWGDGPWQTEPDHIAFEHAGFPCIIHRVATHGGLCGYVAMPPGHPWHRRGYEEIETASVHGGLTYASECRGEICHVAKTGEPDDVWWLGFDMAHSGDYSPAMKSLRGHSPEPWESYKTVDYVRAECERLAEQARDAAPR